MTDINVERNLLGLEDLLIGIGQVTQSRAGVNVPVTRISAANFPYNANQTLAQKIDSLDTTQYVDGDNLPVYIATPHSTTDLNLLDVIWVKDISSVEKRVYYYDKLMFKFNPTTGDLILDPTLFNSSISALTVAYTAADTAVYNTLTGLINQEIADRATAIASLTAAYQAADSALVTSLNLKEGAHLDTGTLAGNLIKLDSTSKLPAVDGSQLLNLPSAAIITGTPLRVLNYTNNVTTGFQVNGGSYFISGSSVGATAGYSLFSQSYTPVGANNKLRIGLTIPTKASPDLETGYGWVIAAIFIGSTHINTIRFKAGTIGKLDSVYIIPNNVNPFTVNVRFGGNGNSYSGSSIYAYINDTTFGGQFAELLLEEIKG